MFRKEKWINRVNYEKHSRFVFFSPKFRRFKISVTFPTARGSKQKIIFFILN